MSKISKMKCKLEEIRKEMTETARDAFVEAFKTFFDANETVEALRWTQYTPYFNDGEACVFSVHDLHAKFVGHVPDAEAIERTDEDEAGFEYVSSYGTDKNKKRDKAILKWWTNIADDDLLEYAFGDHVQVTVDRDGIEVDEYDHD